MSSPPNQDPTPGSILRELIFNQYQAIVLGGSALVSLIALNPLPLMVWLGSELVLLPILDSGPLRRLVARRKLAKARADAQMARERVIAGLTPPHANRYMAMDALCQQIEANYRSLNGISQAYLAEQRGKLDVILQSCLHRLMALQRYERMPATRTPMDISEEIIALEEELRTENLPERAAAALRKNLELKQRLLTSLSEVDANVKTLATELDSLEALLDVLHQNSISLRDPQAISDELDTIVRQSEESGRVVREMEALLPAELPTWDGDASAAPPQFDRSGSSTAPQGKKVKNR